MPEIRLEHGYKDGFPYVKFEGDLTVSSFAALHLVVKGASQLGQVPVIADLSGNVVVSEEVARLKCPGLRTGEEVPEWATRVTLTIITSPELLEEIRSLTLPHQLQPTTSIQEAVALLKKKMEEVPG